MGRDDDVRDTGAVVGVRQSMVWYGWNNMVGYHGMVTRVLGGGAIPHLVATHSWVENAALWRQEWEGPYHTIPGGTTQERRGPEGHNFQPRNPPEKESRLAATVSTPALCGRCQMSDVFMYDVRSFNGRALGVG